MTKYQTRVSCDAEGTFHAIVTYEGHMIPGLPMRSYATRRNAERGARDMLAWCTKHGGA